MDNYLTMLPINIKLNCRKILHTYIHNITPVILEGLGRGNFIVHPHFASYVFKCHIIGGEPIAINRAQIQTPRLLLRNSLFKNAIVLWPTWESNPGPQRSRLRPLDQRGSQFTSLINCLIMILLPTSINLYLHVTQTIIYLFLITSWFWNSICNWLGNGCADLFY